MKSNLNRQREKAGKLFTNDYHQKFYLCIAIKGVCGVCVRYANLRFEKHSQLITLSEPSGEEWGAGQRKAEKRVKKKTKKWREQQAEWEKFSLFACLFPIGKKKENEEDDTHRTDEAHRWQSVEVKKMKQNLDQTQLKQSKKERNKRRRPQKQPR